MNFKKIFFTLILLHPLTTTAQKRIFLLIGPPTSGKTSVAKWCAKRCGWNYLSTEALCNKLAQEKTNIGKQIKQFVQTGQLAPDNIIIPIVNKQLEQAFQKNDTVILESFPRTTKQAEALLLFLKTRYATLKFTVIQMHASDKTIHDRIQNRYICAKCHASYILTKNSPLVPKKHMTCGHCGISLTRKRDDENQSIQERIDIFRAYEKPLLNFFKKKKINIFEFTIKLEVAHPLEKQFEKIAQLIMKT